MVAIHRLGDRDFGVGAYGRCIGFTVSSWVVSSFHAVEASTGYYSDDLFRAEWLPTVLSPTTMSMSNSLFKLPHVETAPKRVRVLFGGQYIVDTDNAKLV